MKPITQKVLERLNYEKLLITPGLYPRKLRITLDEMLEAAHEEARIYTTIPALILFKPAAIYQLSKALEKQVEVREFVKNMFQAKLRPKKFFGIDAQDCVNVVENYRRFLLHKKFKTKFKTFTFRLAEDEVNQLKKLSEKIGKKNLSDTIRTLVAEKLKELEVSV